MNKDIIRMAREAGLHSAVLLHLYDGKEAALTDSERDELRRLERFAALIRAAEQDRCCRIVYGMAGSDNVAQRTVDAIRSQK